MLPQVSFPGGLQILREQLQGPHPSPSNLWASWDGQLASGVSTGATSPPAGRVNARSGGLWELLSGLRIQNFLCAGARLPVSFGVLSRAGCSF